MIGLSAALTRLYPLGHSAFELSIPEGSSYCIKVRHEQGFVEGLHSSDEGSKISLVADFAVRRFEVQF